LTSFISLQPINDQVQVSYNLRGTEIDVMAVLIGQKAGWFGVGVEQILRR
jgi:hypothetical protein